MIEEWSEEMFKELDAKYSVTLEVVSPYAALWSNLCSAFQSSGYDSDDMPEDPLEREYAVVELLSEFGTKAFMDQKVGNNKSILLANARKVAKEMNNYTFGFKMDSPQNACGNTGWDFIKGDIGWAGKYNDEDLPFA